MCELTVVDALPSLIQELVEDSYPRDDGGQLGQLLLLVLTGEGQEGPQLLLRKHTLQCRWDRK